MGFRLRRSWKADVSPGASGFLNSMIEDKKPIVPPHATSNIPSAPPQTIKNQNDTESGVSRGDYPTSSRENRTSACLKWNFPEPPNTFAGGPGNSNGGGGGGTGGDLDFDELARRFDQLKKK
ncbi:hypothetical protein Y032_0368g70 [Ancylostoma ceylanicum]|uniref:Uncharacterized protein n=1 Tax=Ancylostoma ceylanicum TaxID=53326 RepID=A0A016RVG1_9BILA|nr:hypothetical protein Y032_0368g70 [Ancylostoma ceylanicum]